MAEYLESNSDYRDIFEKTPRNATYPKGRHFIFLVVLKVWRLWGNVGAKAKVSRAERAVVDTPHLSFITPLLSWHRSVSQDVDTPSTRLCRSIAWIHLPHPRYR